MVQTASGAEQATDGAAGQEHRSMDRAKLILSGLAGAALSALIGYFVLHQQLATDFAVFWSAHQVPDPYDVQELRVAIGEAIGTERLPATDWPYPYPPTFLLLTAWFELLPFNASYLLWISLTGGALAASARHPASPLILLSPWVIYALMGGQTSMALGALILFALVVTDRPWIAGALLGIAICIKPQFVALVLVGLAFGRNWRVIFRALLSATLIALVTTVVYGARLWIAWLELLPRMVEYTQDVGSHLDLPGWPLKLVALLIGLIFIWKSFRTSNPEDKVISAVATSLLCLPHSLWYNAAMLAPALLSAATRRGWPAVPALAGLAFRASSLSIAAVALWLVVWPAHRRRLS